MLSVDEQAILQLITKSKKKTEILAALVEAVFVSEKYDDKTKMVLRRIYQKVKETPTEILKRPDYFYAMKLLYSTDFVS